MQDKIVAAVDGHVKDAGLQSVQKWGWANIGTVHVTPAGSFEPLFSVAMNFQDGYMSGTILRPGERNLLGCPVNGKVEFRERGFGFVKYENPGDISGFLGAVKAECARYAPRARAAAGAGGRRTDASAARLLDLVDGIGESHGAAAFGVLSGLLRDIAGVNPRLAGSLASEIEAAIEESLAAAPSR